MTCSCRRSLSELDLIAAYGGDAPTPQDHSEPHYNAYNVDAAASRALLVARRQRAESAAALSRAAEQRARAAFRLVKR